MKSEVRVFDRGNGEIQRVQVVSWDDWSQLDFLYLKQENEEQQKRALSCFYHIYKNFLIPTKPWIFPQMVMFVLPEEDDMMDFLVECAKSGMKVDGEAVYYASEKYGNVSDPLTIATILLQEGIRIKKQQVQFLNPQAEKLYRELEKRGCAHVVCGKYPKTKVIPVGRFAGYLSEVEKDAKVKANANFFIMDPFDCATVYDQVGTPFGLCIKDGVVENPPLYNREALLIEQEGASYISEKDIHELIVAIGDKTYVSGKNATIYTRPKYAKTPDDNRIKLVIIGRQVVAVKVGGSVQIPASGFVLCIEKKSHSSAQVTRCGSQTVPNIDVSQPVNTSGIYPGDLVTYHGLKDVKFGIQIGNSIIRKGVKTEQFISHFYDIYKFQRTPYPPSLYPMDFNGARAARMALGADADAKPVLFWAEGKGKLSYTPGQDSTGASLSEMAEIAEALGLRNAINLDGGGSAQILFEGERMLHISDRNLEDNSDAERLVPAGLIVR